MPRILDLYMKGLIGVMLADLIVRGIDFYFAPPPPPPEHIYSAKALGLLCFMSAAIVSLGIVMRRHRVTMIGCVCAAGVAVALTVGWIDDVALWPPSDWRNLSKYIANTGGWSVATFYAWTLSGITEARLHDNTEP